MSKLDKPFQRIMDSKLTNKPLLSITYSDIFFVMREAYNLAKNELDQSAYKNGFLEGRDNVLEFISQNYPDEQGRDHVIIVLKDDILELKLNPNLQPKIYLK